jgi:ATP-dependent Lhr-like helicase
MENLDRILDALEEQESKLLSWGDTGGMFSIDELFTLFENQSPSEDPDDVLDEMLDRGMLTPCQDPVGKTVGYRTRMAHGVHLYRNLRQWMHGQDLNASKTLVSDFRFLRRPRRYPERDLTISPLIQQWQQELNISSVVSQALVAQVGEFELSGFQARATARILKAWPQHTRRVKHASATIICAGTGSGKTMAFYLPALSSLADDVMANSQSRVRILAIYPRQELLKDQFNETWGACRQLDALVQSVAGRKLRIGAMFGKTPTKLCDVLNKSGQQYFHSGLLKCPTKDCDGEMRWNKADVEAKKERLVCHLCRAEIGGDEVALTRDSMKNNPPDIVFTTTEMLNQQMGNPKFQKLFGINTSKPVPLVLLDEVHTYGGNPGAQTAFLLRRWMKLSQCSPHFVGLSATLVDAENFFARLTGVNRSRVRLVEPHAEEMKEEGAEYLMALRGDPVSQTALLSTTIQASMLTRRLLDERVSKPSAGVWGSKTFVFTDDLDANNRLYSQLADAEGWWQRGGKLVENPNGPLAQLRNPNISSYSKQQLAMFGQDWSGLQRHGFSLDSNDRAAVSRTSSQDSGVVTESDLVVATASLEVGFNDPCVGAVIQHKAPRNVASYLQRKGRAGRTRIMRPWMIIVLSEFGQDRETYQHYERLLDPQVKIQGLPIDNGHIQRMQAAMAALNWFAGKMGGSHLWYLLNSPNEKGNLRGQLPRLLEMIEGVIQPGLIQDELTEYLGDALALDDGAINSILWQPPRSILMEFLPTLRRRLTTLWGSWDTNLNALQPWVEMNRRYGSPVPEFIPAQLFSELNLPELHIALQRGNQDYSWENMRFVQALKEFAPGRISKRFSTHSGLSSDWLLPVGFEPEVEDHNSTIQFDVEQAFGPSKTELGEFPIPGTNDKIKVYRPFQILTQSLFNSNKISDTSNAFLKWHSIFNPVSNGDRHTPPTASLWGEHLMAIDFYSHRAMMPVEIVRYNTGSQAEFKFKDTRKARVDFTWHKNESPVGVGARLSVDAVRFNFNISQQQLLTWLKEPELMSILRTSYLQDCLRDSEACEKNRFVADWVYECFLSTVAIESVSCKCSIAEAIDKVISKKSTIALSEIPELLFQQNIAQADLDAGGDAIELKDQKLQVDLAGRLQDPIMLKELKGLGESLYCDLTQDPEFIHWSRNILANTLASGICQTVCSLLPDVDERSLIADPIVDYSSGQLTIWLSEQDSGGTGVITQLQENYCEDPLRFLGIFSRNFGVGDYEQLGIDLQALLKCNEQSNEIVRAMNDVRLAQDHKTRLAANNALKSELGSAGFLFSHSFSAVLYSRILKPGSSSHTDIALSGYLERWVEMENDLGFELPMNLAAFVIAAQDNISKAAIFHRACQIQSVLWPRGANVRQAALSFYNPFMASNIRTERLLAAKLCIDNTPSVTLDEDDWMSKVHGYLRNLGRVDLLIPREKRHVTDRVIAHLHVSSVDTLGLFFYPRVKSVQNRGKDVELRIELAEALF